MTSPVPDLTVVTVDIDAPLARGFTVDRPHGSGDWVLVAFTAPVAIATRHGREQARAGACILLGPTQPTWYSAPGEGALNHYVHLAGAGVGPLVAALGLPRDELFHPPAPEALREQLAELRREWALGGPHAATLLAFLAGRLLATLARRLAPAAALPDPRQRRVHERLHQIRNWLVEQPGRHQSVAWIAEQAGLNAAYLSTCWRRTFGIGPQEDLIRIRLERACRLLADGTLAVAEVARRCGFADAHYFSKLFRARLGRTPSAYAAAARPPAP